MLFACGKCFNFKHKGKISRGFQTIIYQFDFLLTELTIVMKSDRLAVKGKVLLRKKAERTGLLAFMTDTVLNHI